MMLGSIPKACHGGETIDAMIGTEHAQECQFCGTKVRNDCVDHPQFGFEENCDHWLYWLVVVLICISPLLFSSSTQSEPDKKMPNA